MRARGPPRPENRRTLHRAGAIRTSPSRPLPDHDDFMANLAALELVDRVGEDVEPLFHHQPAEEGDDGDIVADTPALPPAHVAAARIEDVALDSRVQMPIS